MFRYRRRLILSLCCFVIVGCASPTPPAPVRPTNRPPHGYHITLFDQNGTVSQRYDIGPNDIIRDEPLRQEIWFRVGGQEKHFHGSYQKEPY